MCMFLPESFHSHTSPTDEARETGGAEARAFPPSRPFTRGGSSARHEEPGEDHRKRIILSGLARQNVSLGALSELASERLAKRRRLHMEDNKSNKWLAWCALRKFLRNELL